MLVLPPEERRKNTRRLPHGAENRKREDPGRAACQIPQQANALLVEDVGKISHDYSTALRVLEFLQDHGAVLICTQCDVSYVLYIKGLSQALHQRAVRKGLGLPWWTGGERYTEINRAAGND